MSPLSTSKLDQFSLHLTYSASALILRGFLNVTMPPDVTVPASKLQLTIRTNTKFQSCRLCSHTAVWTPVCFSSSSTTTSFFTCPTFNIGCFVWVGKTFTFTIMLNVVTRCEFTICFSNVSTQAFQYGLGLANGNLITKDGILMPGVKGA